MAIAGLAALLLLPAAAAQDRKGPAANRELAARLEEAHRLAQDGRAKGEPQALIEAARILRAFPDRVLAAGQRGRSGAAYDIEALLREAQRLAPGDASVAAATAELEQDRAAASGDEWWEQVCDGNGDCRWVRWVCTGSNLCQQVEE